ncbi:FAD-binding oxidoreductase [Xanthobacter sp. V2C-8]|uniref:NAD(P)/FAD-dependent oxidoreductase n=1 Tax=Xanthobacter albus TaxID=3119929 RepID=UPI00372A5295
MLSGRGAGLVPPRLRARPVTSDTRLPSHCDVVVVGAGIVGMSTALTLSERGLSVVVCEKGAVAGEASGRAIGWIDNTFLAPAKAPLIQRSKALWADLDRRTGLQTGYRRSGLVVPFTNTEDADRAAAWIASLSGAQDHSDGARAGSGPCLVGRAQANDLLPAAGDPWIGALVNDSDGYAEPKLATSALADAFRQAGGKLFQSCAVRGIETQAGRICGVVTEKGAISAQAVVLAGGVWSPLFLGSLGIPLPQLQAFASAASIAPVAGGPPRPGMASSLIWRNESDGGYTIGQLTGAAPITPAALRWSRAFLPALKAMWSELDPVFGAEFWRQLHQPRRWALDAPSPFESCRILEPETRDWILADARAAFGDAFMNGQTPRIREAWAGALSTLPDNMPVLAPLEKMPGLFIASGLYYGLTMGPAAGELMADLVMAQTPQVDPKLFRYERFFDGTKLVFQP